MTHLRRNSDQQEQEKQAMASSMEWLLSDDYDEILRREFERRCSFGERMNTELMASSKWVKLLREIGAVVPLDWDRNIKPESVGAILHADADIIFRKVLRDCDYGGNRLNYGLFCKALYLVAIAARPKIESEVALNEILERIAQVAPEESRLPEEAHDLMLDPNVLLVLDHFKPALHDLFHSFCNRRLSNPASGSFGTGTMRLRALHCSAAVSPDSVSGKHRSVGVSQNFSVEGFGLDSPSRRGQALQKFDESQLDELPLPRRHTEADAGGGYQGHGRTSQCIDEACDDVSPLTASTSAPSFGFEKTGYPTLLASPGGRVQSPNSVFAGSEGCSPALSWADVTLRSSRTSLNGSCWGSSKAAQDPYLYSNGAPVIENRRSNMSHDQLYDLCKQLKVTPDLLSRVEVAKVFKRAQCAGAVSPHGGSLHGFLSKEAFVDAAGQLAIAAFSKQPFCEEYILPHDKVYAFFVKMLPSCPREVHDRFLYGRGR